MKLFGEKVDRTNAILAVIVGLATLVVYVRTMAPTVSFWDCGEFIAVSATLGIPHPPGTPLYVLVGRIFSILPFFSDIAARVNFLSSLSSSITAVFGYLVVVRLLRTTTSEDLLGRFLAYAGGAAGAFLMAFGLTQWTNSVETEVYGLSMAMLLAIVWLSLIYLEHRGTAMADRIMLGILYLATLGIGVHMTTFIILPICALLFVFKKDMPRDRWFLVGGLVAVELILVFILSSRPGEIPFYLPVLVVFVFMVLATFSFEPIRRNWLIFTGGLAGTLLPGLIWLFNKTSGADQSVPGAVSIIGGVALAGTSAFAIISLLRYFKLAKPSGEDRIRLVYPSVLVLTAAILSLIVVSGLNGIPAFLILSTVLIATVVWLLRTYIRWMELVALAAILMIIIGLKEFAIALLAALVIIAIIAAVTKNGRWKIAVAMILVTAIGYSVHAFIPVRSAQDPYINQNDPSASVQATVGFIERKQYGSTSMIERMFTRRGEWENQFGIYRRMGMLHFFHQQFGLSGTQALVPFLLGVLGIWELTRRRPRRGVLVLLLLLVTSVGLVLYMNFADGTRQLPNGQDYLEVRDRDYFFTPFFVLFGLVIGTGITAAVQMARELTASFSKAGRSVLVGLLCLLFLFPIVPLMENHSECDRSRNFFAFDYAWSLLQSADENAVLFTTGDNDTFPLWCLQEAYGIRKDVRIVNLSLANANWYIRQLRDYMGLNIGYTDAQVDSLRHYRIPDGPLVRIAHQVIDALVYSNPTVPINWAFTTAPSFRQVNVRSIDNQLVLNGLVWRFDPAGRQMRINVDNSYDFFTSPDGFRMRDLGDPDIHKNATTIRVVGNLVNPIIMVADSLLRAQDYERAERLARLAKEAVPFRTDGAVALAAVLADQGKTGELQELAETMTGQEQMAVAVLQARAYRGQGDIDRARVVLEGILREHPSAEPAFEELLRLLVEQKAYSEVFQLVRQWVLDNPEHQRGRDLLRQLQEGLPQAEDQPAQSQQGNSQ